MNSKLYLLLLLFLCALPCCTSVRPCPAETPSIFLSQVAERSTGIHRIYFPAGRYSPDFQSSRGIYYSSEKKISLGGFANLGINRPMRGGVFIPFPSDSDQRHAFWLDHQDFSQGLVGFAASSNTRVWRFKPALNYHVIR